MDVRTNAANGFLFHVADRRQIDKVFAYLKDGYIYFGFDYGSGSLVLTSNIQVNDGEWHQVGLCAIIIMWKFLGNIDKVWVP